MFGAMCYGGGGCRWLQLFLVVQRCEARTPSKTWHHPTRPQDVIDLRFHVETPHLGKMYDDGAPGQASEK
jgi:hypothetical protein